MKIYLRATNGDWALHEGDLAKELKSRNIVISDKASLGAGASLGAWAIVGAGAIVGTTYQCIVMGPFGSRDATLTAYPHKDSVWIGTGCFLGPIDDCEKAVRETHRGTEHERQYLAALHYVRARFALLSTRKKSVDNPLTCAKVWCR